MGLIYLISLLIFVRDVARPRDKRSVMGDGSVLAVMTKLHVEGTKIKNTSLLCLQCQYQKTSKKVRVIIIYNITRIVFCYYLKIHALQ